MARIDSLGRERQDVANEFEAFAAKDLAAVNVVLASKKMDAIPALTRAAWEKANRDADDGAGMSGGMPAALFVGITGQ